MSVISNLSRQILSVSNFPSISRQSIRQFRQKRKNAVVDTSKQSPVVEPEIKLPPAQWSDLVKPAMFTVAFTGGTIGFCAIWQYENMRAEAIKSRFKEFGWAKSNSRKVGELREKVRQWWSSLNEGQKLFWPICGINAMVLLAWKLPPLQPLMMKWFLCSPAASTKCIPMLLSTFSHISLFHFGCNMMVLHSFMPTAVHLMGKEQFLGVYLSAGVITSFASMGYKVATRSSSFSLGASGAICAVVGLFSQFYPDARLSILFLPMITFSAATGVKGLMALDAAGCVMRWGFFDHMAHLSGVLFGIGWAHYGAAKIWGNREGLVTAWHNVRNK